jgi:iron complex outermembrane receptor protein
VTEEAFNINNHVAFNVESRVFPIVKLTYTRSFGNSVTNSARKQGNESNEEKDRIRKD